MKKLTFPLTVIVEDEVPEGEVWSQLQDAIDPDAWNWEVQLLDCTSNIQVCKNAHEHWEHCSECPE